MTLLDLCGVGGLLAIAFALVILGLLSRRLGQATRAPRHYLGFYAGALLIVMSVIAQLLNLGFGLATPEELDQSLLWILLYNGLPALGVTVGLFYAWHYWSWLLAERG